MSCIHYVKFFLMAAAVASPALLSGISEAADICTGVGIHQTGLNSDGTYNSSYKAPTNGNNFQRFTRNAPGSASSQKGALFGTQLNSGQPVNTTPTYQRVNIHVPGNSICGVTGCHQ